MEITATTVRELFDYDPDTGILTWRPRRNDHPSFKKDGYNAKRNAAIWNSHYAGKPAGSLHKKGYVCTTIGSRSYRNQRLIWLYVHGYVPEQVDHINGQRCDNRLINLRAATRFENSRNRKIRHDSASGHIGVSWHKTEKKWRAHICRNGKMVTLGRFANINDAITARRTAEVKFYGEFSRLTDSGQEVPSTS